MIMNFLKRFINLVPITILVTVLIFPFIAFSQSGNVTSKISISPSTIKTDYKVGDSFSQVFKVSGTDDPFPEWDFTPRTVGLSGDINADNDLLIEGKLTTITSFTMEVSVLDKKGNRATRTFKINVTKTGPAEQPVPPTTTPTDNGAGPGGNSAAPGTKPPANNPSGGGSSNNSGEFYNPLGKVNTIPALIVQATKIILALTGMLAVLFIIIGGLRYITSGGSPEAVKSAKNTVTYAIIGLVIAVMAFAIVNVVTNLLINK
jgi:hypothetical protein